MAKIESVVNILDCNFKEGEHWLVYCEDTDQMDQIRDQAEFQGYKPFTYSSGYKNRYDQLRGYIAKGSIVFSMRCLDEGVDIPVISHAVIASSSETLANLFSGAEGSAPSRRQRCRLHLGLFDFAGQAGHFCILWSDKAGSLRNHRICKRCNKIAAVAEAV